MQRIPIPVHIADKDILPTYATCEASGADLRAWIVEPISIQSGASAIIPTGIRCDIPKGYEIQIRPRSGFAAKNQVTVLNTPGTIDSDYRGEIAVILINHGKDSFLVTPKMRIAQMVLSPVVQAEFFMVDRLSETERGEGKFGQTGAH